MAGSDLQGGQDTAIDRAKPRQRLRVDLVDAMNAHDFFNEVGLAFHVATPRRNSGLDNLAVAFNAEAKTLQDIEGCVVGNLDARQALDFRYREIDHARRRLAISNHVENCRLAATEFQHQLGCQFCTRNHHFRIDATLETIARIGNDAEFAARARNHARVPESRFDQHIGGVFIATGMLAAHDTGDRFGTVLIGNHIHARLELIFTLIETENGFAILCQTHRQIALDLGSVEDVQRTALIEGHIIGDVDQRIDRAQADGLQTLLHPFGAWAIFHALDHAQCETSAERVLVILIQNDLDRRFAFALHRFRQSVLDRA